MKRKRRLGGFASRSDEHERRADRMIVDAYDNIDLVGRYSRTNCLDAFAVLDLAIRQTEAADVHTASGANPYIDAKRLVPVRQKLNFAKDIFKNRCLVGTKR